MSSDKTNNNKMAQEAAQTARLFNGVNQIVRQVVEGGMDPFKVMGILGTIRQDMAAGVLKKIQVDDKN